MRVINVVLKRIIGIANIDLSGGDDLIYMLN